MTAAGTKADGTGAGGGMGIKLNVNFKIKVNGKEYGSAQELPDAVREAYDRARNDPSALGAGGVAFAQRTKIVVNGQEYAGVGDMPPDVRHMYQKAMEVVAEGKASENRRAEAGQSSPAGRDDCVRRQPSADLHSPIVSEQAFSLRTLVLTALILGVILGVYFLMRSAGH